METSRLVCFDKFCRYYLGLKEHQRPCEWIYISKESVELLRSVAPIDVSRNNVTRYARRCQLILPKIMRKVSWRLIVQTMPKEVVRFIQSRFGELKESKARYSDLLTEADNSYPQYLEELKSILRAI